MLRFKLAIRRTEMRMAVVEAMTAEEAKKIFLTSSCKPFFVQLLQEDEIEVIEIEVPVSERRIPSSRHIFQMRGK